MLARVRGKRARFCNGLCSSSFRCDRAHGAIYMSVRAPEGSYDAETFSLLSGRCCYCSAIVTKRTRLKPAPDRPRVAS